MRRIIYTITVVLFALVLTNCYYDNEEAIYGEEQCSPEAVTYSGRIATIIQNNCASCHNSSLASGGIVLDTYANVKTQADNGNLVGVITHSSGFSPMPKNAPKLSTCDILAIQTWVENQALNN